MLGTIHVKHLEQFLAQSKLENKDSRVGENILEEETVQCLYKYGAYIQLVGTFYKQRRLLVNILFFSMFSVMIPIFSMKWTEH